MLNLRLQNGCFPDHVPLGKQILSAEPYSVCPTAHVKRTLLPTLKFPASLLAWAGVPGSPQEPEESPATRDNQTWSNDARDCGVLPLRLWVYMCVCTDETFLNCYGSSWQYRLPSCQVHRKYMESCGVEAWFFRKQEYWRKRSNGRVSSFYFRSAKVKRTSIMAEHLPFVTMPTTWQTNTSFSSDARGFSVYKKNKKSSEPALKVNQLWLYGIMNTSWPLKTPVNAFSLSWMIPHSLFFCEGTCSTFRMITLHNVPYLTMY